uniref:Uncharacterized protein n=1 Tax=Allium cepa TaxID=4679 RepID=Q2XNX4_ALLCE|nr:hypothetical protein 11.t00007 [Allium cepa]
MALLDQGRVISGGEYRPDFLRRPKNKVLQPIVSDFYAPSLGCRTGNAERGMQVENYLVVEIVTRSKPLGEPKQIAGRRTSKTSHTSTPNVIQAEPYVYAEWHPGRAIRQRRTSSRPSHMFMPNDIQAEPHIQVTSDRSCVGDEVETEVRTCARLKLVISRMSAPYGPPSEGGGSSSGSIRVREYKRCWLNVIVEPLGCGSRTKLVIEVVR